MNNFFDTLLTRKEFVERLIELSFNTPTGWSELFFCIALMWLTHWISATVLKKYAPALPKDNLPHFVQHLIRRLLWPLLLLVATIVAMFIWRAFTHNPVLWLQLLLMATYWMIIIRVALAVLRTIIPNNRFSSALEYSLSSLLWICFLLWLTGADSFIIHLLKSLALPVGSARISLYTIITGTITVGIGIIIALWVSKLLDERILKAKQLDLNLRYVLSKVIKT